MNFKKISTMLLAIVMLLTVFSVSAFANENSNIKILYTNKDVITDIEVLWERAKNGISDLGLSSTDNISKSTNEITLSGDIENFSTKTFSTSQLLEVKEEAGVIKETISTTNFSVFIENKENETKINKDELLITPLANHPKDDWDGTYAVRAYSNVVYTRLTDKHGVEHIDISSVSGGWSYDGSGGYTLSGRKVRYGQVGPSSFGGTNGQYEDKTPTGNSFSYTVPSSWVPAFPNEKGSYIGVNSWIDISRGTSTWTLSLENHIEK